MAGRAFRPSRVGYTLALVRNPGTPDRAVRVALGTIVMVAALTALAHMVGEVVVGLAGIVHLVEGVLGC